MYPSLGEGEKPGLADFRDDEYVCKVARTVDEAKNLIEEGFDHVTDIDGMKLFRKRK